MMNIEMIVTLERLEQWRRSTSPSGQNTVTKCSSSSTGSMSAARFHVLMFFIAVMNDEYL